MRLSIRRRLLALAALVPAALSLGVLGAAPAFAATPTNMAWSLSNSATSATSVYYTWQFTTATTGTIATVTLTVPTGTAGTPAVSANYGIGAGSVALAGTTITYTVTSPASVASGTSVYIELSGLTNSGTAGSYTSVITTLTSAPATIDTGSTPSVSLGGNTTSATVVVDKSLAFTNDTASWQFLMDAGVAALADQTKVVNLSVKTNAHNGYTLNVKDSSLTAGGGKTIGAVSTGMATGVASGSFTNDRFGYSSTVSSSGGSGLALAGAGAGGGNYVGYTTAGENAFTATGATGNSADTIAVTNRVKITYATGAAVYTDTITYTVTPSY